MGCIIACIQCESVFCIFPMCDRVSSVLIRIVLSYFLCGCVVLSVWFSNYFNASLHCRIECQKYLQVANFCVDVYIQGHLFA